MKKPKRPLSFRQRRKGILKLLKQVKKIVKEREDQYYIPYIDHIIRHVKLLEKESEYIQELYLQVAARGYRGNFREFISNSPEDDAYGWAITGHNSKVRAEFLLAGINFQRWLEYNGEENIESSEEMICKNRELSWKALDRSLDLLLVILEKTPLYGSLRKDCIEIRKQKTVVLNGDYIVPEDWQRGIFPKLHQTCLHLRHSGCSFNLNGTAEDFDLLQNRIKSMLGSFSKVPLKKKFNVRLWRREPQFDLLQGNFSDCCIAIGVEGLYPAVHLPDVPCRKYPAGILNYLTDLGVQVAEVYDASCEPDQQIGQCWLYASLDDDGKPVLVADSFDLHAKYKNSEAQRSAIRDCMFEFLKKYSSQCGISKVVLGRDGPLLKNLTRHKIHNSVYVDSMTVVNFQKPIEKLGGYFLNRPYFLETRGGRSAYLIAENLPVSPMEKTQERILKIWEYLSTKVPINH